ncbi:MAG: hypothetical protein OEW79_03370 [Betaproteobacteria bacterium]|jgi:hypothetical protein|nr:hypothetical protein [Betaproteobacteria bacterium]MDH5341856.1 hypothetical protein [Betaproteobacteria bacterium]
MDHGIWAIWYDIAGEHRNEYIHWFHEVHIPEKLSRPGYLWAAHYELGHGGRGKGYLALFGGENTHTFLNPSPGQLAKKQSPESRKFIGMRQKAMACILAEEARVDGPDAANRGPGLTTAPVVQIGNYNAPSPAVEDDLGAWYAQQRLPMLAKLPGCIGARKMLATVGVYKHAILHEFSAIELRELHFSPHEAERDDPDTWMGRIVPHLTHAPYSPAVGMRLWPAV